MKFILLLLPVLVFGAEYDFTNKTGLSIVKAGGNSDLETYNLQTDTTGTKGKSTLGFGGHYTLGTADGTESARNWDGNVKYSFKQTKNFGYYTAVQYEGDEFAGYDQRNNYDLGFKYVLANDDKVKSHFELGYRYTEEMLTNGPDEDFQKGRLFYTYSRKASKTLSYAFWTEYIPNFDEEQDFLINFEPSLSVALDDTFSLKVAYRGSYDGQPQFTTTNGVTTENERLDYVQTTSLIANF